MNGRRPDKYFSACDASEGLAALAKKEGIRWVGRSPFPPRRWPTMVMQLYAGPKEYDTLKLLNVGWRTRSTSVFVFGSGVCQGCGEADLMCCAFSSRYTQLGITIIF